jgi:hypothetical protein
MPDFVADMGHGPTPLRYVPTTTVAAPADTNTTDKLVKSDAPLKYSTTDKNRAVLCAVDEVPELIALSRVEAANGPVGCAVVPNASAGMRESGSFIMDLPFSGSDPGGDRRSILADGAGGYKIVVAAKSTVRTGVVGNNNAIDWTARDAGPGGNSVTVALVDPAGNSQPLTVSVAGLAISVSLATSSGGAITSTAAQVIAAIRAHAAADDLVTVANASTSTGAGVVVAVAATPLAGGKSGVGLVLSTANARMLVQF